jgi:two-component system, cell cycle response regulator DivK
MSAKLILIVEDNEKNRKLVRDVLQFKGFATVESASAEEGLRLARDRQPDLILLDIQLPGIDGIEALRRLRCDPVTARIPVIAVTASAMAHDQSRIMNAGFDDYQRKPLDIRELVEVVRHRVEAGRRPYA